MAQQIAQSEGWGPQTTQSEPVWTRGQSYQAPSGTSEAAVPVGQSSAPAYQAPTTETATPDDRGEAESCNYSGTNAPEGMKGSDWIKGLWSMKGGLKDNVSGLSQMQGAMDIDAQNQYNTEAEAAKELGRYSVESGLKPVEAEYTNVRPTQTSKLQNSTLTKGKISKGGERQGANAVISALSTGGIGHLVEGVGGKKWAGFSEFAGNRVGRGALSGAAGGWQSAIVSGIIGGIVSIFEWSAAKGKDDAAANADQAQFLHDMKEWEARKNLERKEKILAKINERKQAGGVSQANRAGSVGTRRDQYMALLADATQRKYSPVPTRYSAPTAGRK